MIRVTKVVSVLQADSIRAQIVMERRINRNLITEAFLADRYLGFSVSRPTVGVTGAGAGVNSVWEQKKLEARKILENGDESHLSSAP
jgi:hypothetical protein